MIDRLCAALLVFAAAAVSHAGPPMPSPAARLVASSRVLVIAHRGDSGAYPENTLPAFESAVRIGTDLVELDYRHSADGIPVVFHDKELDRTTNAPALWGEKKIPVAARTLAELGGLDAGSWRDPKFRGTGIPTLAAALQTIAAGSTTLIERKAGDAETCLRLLGEQKLLDRVVLQAFDWEYLADARRLSPEVVLAALGGNEVSEERLDALERFSPPVVAWSHADVDAAAIRRIHAREKKAWVYTVNDPRRMNELIDDGIDGIITDVPAVLRRVLEERQACTP